MRALILLCFVFFANAQIVDLGKGVLVHLGPFDTSYSVGNFTPRYVPLTQRDYIAGRNARNFVENMRRLFNVGFNVCPPLDPYTKARLPPLSLDNYLDSVQGEVDFTNLVIVGAQQFRQHTLEVRLNSGRVDFEIIIPSLTFDVDVQTSLLLADTIPFHYTGHLSLVLSGVNVTGAVHAVPSAVYIDSKLNFQLVALKYNLQIDDVAVQLKGSNENLNKLIKESLFLGIDVVHDIVPQSLLAKLVYNINKNAAEVVLSESNRMLLLANTEQVLAYLVPQAY